MFAYQVESPLHTSPSLKMSAVKDQRNTKFRNFGAWKPLEFIAESSRCLRSAPLGHPLDSAAVVETLLQLLQRLSIVLQFCTL